MAELVFRVDAPFDELRRDRVERGVFDRLSAMRYIAHARPRRSWVPIALLAIATITTIAIVLAVVVRAGAIPMREPVITRHDVPPGAPGVRWTSERAEVEASGDTAVEQRIDDDGVTLVLARGKVDCAVEPHQPFRVIAGDVVVSVVGTRFAVQRTTTGVRVGVTRGNVRVTSPVGESMLGAGDAWSSDAAITAADPAR